MLFEKVEKSVEVSPGFFLGVLKKFPKILV
jgi:hypothetical protein